MPGTGPTQDRYLQANRPRRNENSRWRICDRSGHYPAFRLPYARFGYWLVALPPPQLRLRSRPRQPRSRPERRRRLDNPSEHLNVFANYSWQATDWYMAGFQRQPYSGKPPPPPCTAAVAGQTPQTCPQQVWTSYGRNQGSSVDLSIESSLPPLSIEGSPILRNRSKFSVNYTYAVTTNLTHANGDSAFGPATSYPNIGTQFHQLIVQYEYPFKPHLALDIGYYFSHFGENDFQWDNLRQWMGSASPNST